MSETTAKKVDPLSNKFRDEVRAAWRKSGSRARVTDPTTGKTMQMRKLTREVEYVSGSESVHKLEHWLVLTPADGSKLPVMQVELNPMGNLRSSVGTK